MAIPQQNIFAEYFIRRLRDERLNETLFSSLAHAREALIEWKDHYSNGRPHSPLRNQPPTVCKTQRSRDATGRIAAQRRRRATEPHRLKCNRNSPYRRMKEGSQVSWSSRPIGISVYCLSAFDNKNPPLGRARG
jgi:hypothetical protein